MLGRPEWSEKLSRPVRVRGRPELRTLGDAIHFILGEIPEDRKRRNEFQVTATLLMKAADSGSAEDIEKATSQLDLALFMNAMLDMKLDRSALTRAD
jgi:hypothetical protein